MGLHTFSSSEQKKKDPNTNPSDFYTDLVPAWNFNSNLYELCLHKALIWNSSLNVIGKTLVWGYNDGSWTDVTIDIDDGTYTVSDINDLLHRSMESEGVAEDLDHDGAINYALDILPNNNLNRVVITVNNDHATAGITAYRIDLNDTSAPNNLRNFFGFDEAVITATATSDNIANVNNDVDSWQIRCDAVRGSYAPNTSGGESEIMINFRPNVPPGGLIELEPLHLVYLQLNSSNINRIRLRLTDQAGNLIDLNGEDVLYQLELRPLQ